MDDDKEIGLLIDKNPLVGARAEVPSLAYRSVYVKSRKETGSDNSFLQGSEGGA
jgi:hypothetical protein